MTQAGTGMVAAARWSLVGGRALRVWVSANLIILVLLLVGSALVSPQFLTATNLFNVLRQISVVGLMATGLTFVIIGGGIDLSGGGVAVVAVVMLALLQQQPLVVALTVPLLFGLGVGLVNAFLVVRLRIQPFIATLAVGIACEGVAYLLTDGKPVIVTNRDIHWLGNGSFAFVPIPVIVYALVMLVAAFVLNRTPFGYGVFGLGGNEEAARLAGVRIALVRSMTFILSGLLAGMAGVILGARIQMGDPGVGGGLVLDAVSGTLLGGTSLLGGIGTIGGTFVGVLILEILINVFNMLNVSYHLQLVARGVVLLAALTVSARRAAP
jgi:ribose/xylose/arabinose/galactoside ABC-type transport system permease subunit